ncbi:MAG: hypothetical protein NVS2B17_17870 [Candidatus Velthaea sp.]
MTTLEQEIIALDRALWQAAMDGRLDDFRGMMASDYQGLYARGFVTADDDAQVTATMRIRGFRFEDVRVRELGPQTVLVTYITLLDATAGEARDISGRYASTSVWQRAKGGWSLVYHAESRLAERSG